MKALLGLDVGMDLYIAFGLIVIVVIVLLISKMGILPKKSLPYLIAGLLGIFGVSILKRKRIKRLDEDLQRKEKQLKDEEDKLERFKKDYDASEKELQKVKAELQAAREAHEKEILMLMAENKKAKNRIDKLYGRELDREFLRKRNGS